MGRTLIALRKADALQRRLEAAQGRHDSRAWMVKRRERTRQLIELGGLIAKAGIVELADDDRAVILGLLLAGAATLQGDQREEALMRWRRRGKRAFEADAAALGRSTARDGITR